MKCLISFSSLMMLLEPLRSKAYLHICPLQSDYQVHHYQRIEAPISKIFCQRIFPRHFFLFLMATIHLWKKKCLFLLLLNKLDFKRVQINKWKRSWEKSMLHSIMAFSENSQENWLAHSNFPLILNTTELQKI